MNRSKKKQQKSDGNNTAAVEEPTPEITPEATPEAAPEVTPEEPTSEVTPGADVEPPVGHDSTGVNVEVTDVDEDGDSADIIADIPDVQPQEPTDVDTTADGSDEDTSEDTPPVVDEAIDHESYSIDTVSAALELLEGEDIPFADKIIILRNSDLEEIRQYIAVFIDYAKNMNGKPVEGANNNYFLEKAIMRALKHEDLEVSKVMLNIQEGYFKDIETNPAFKIEMLTRLSEKSKLSESKITQLHMVYMALTRLAVGDKDVFVDAIADEEIVSKLKTFYNM